MLIYMKNNNTNIALKALALLFTLQTHTLRPIQMPSCLVKFNTGTGVHYIKNCQKIDEYVKKIGALNFCYTNTRNKTDKINSIQKQLAAFETKLLAAEQQALLAIKEKYQISNEIWQKYMADVHRMKTIYTKNLKKKNPNIVHDPNIPAHILEMLFSLLQQNGINPHSINIKMITDQQTIDENPHTTAQAESYMFFTISDASDQNFLSYKYEPSSIAIFPQMLTQNANDRLSTCAHEIQHIMQHHTLVLNILFVYLNHYYNVTHEAFKQTPEHHQLTQIYEAQAEILAAIKNPKIAACLKIKRETAYYLDHLYEEHFFQLAHINMLWKTREWLENCSKNNVIRTI
jgi:hypothetical protein